MTAFLTNVMASMLVLYVPGYLLARGLFFSRCAALLGAPFMSLAACYCIIAACEVFEIPCHPTVLCACLVIALAVFIIGRLVARHQGVLESFRWSDTYGPVRIGRFEVPFAAIVLCAYVGFGVAVGAYVYISSLGDAATFYSRFDNQTHLNNTRTFLETGAWSIFHSQYNDLATSAAQTPYAQPPSEGYGFYPAGFHAMVALVATVCGDGNLVAINAFVAVLTMVVFPLSVAGFIMALFPGRRLVVGCGALMAMAFSAIPWSLILKGPLYPNLLSFVLLPMALGIVYTLFQERCEGALSKSARVLALASLFVALAFSHPNALFTICVFVVPYIGTLLKRRLCSRNGAPKVKRPAHVNPRRRTVLYWLVFWLAAAVIWLVALKLPFLQSVTSMSTEKSMGFARTLYNVGTFGLASTVGQPLLAIIVWLSVVLSIFQKERLWMLIPLGFSCASFIICAAGITPLNTIVGGFWYTDPFRIAANCALFAMPYACEGMARLVTWTQNLVDKYHAQCSLRHGKQFATALLLGVFTIVNFFPSCNLNRGQDKVVTAFGDTRQWMVEAYGHKGEDVYSTAERDFVQKALDVLPEGALVLNSPNDGSVFAYGTDDLNTYYRTMDTSDYKDSALTISQGLNRIADDAEVQKAVEETGAEYLLMLDQGVAFEDLVKFPQYKDPEPWKGIDGVSDATPDFEVVLEDGDMRLYKIVEK
ncbi:DUF6541 family protein [Xiamenia xianingshaonis]|uniref:Uncharacterized protein n=1 Tax=Xiamenia xianingshaonis TaxID=2682776 RepID=A0A9E6SU53_9ACTN|nr:DUF6541 family protein [Xiamenia xianingshaonis]NHM14212.1 hypothetical protein [Xiamenia xianingshaonis]QTU84175.1 hypothetical protein J7S26_07440 [Xiamenia xianingshaonis]